MPPLIKYVSECGEEPGGREIQNFPVLNYRSLEKDSGLYCRRSKAINLSSQVNYKLTYLMFRNFIITKGRQQN